MEKDDVTERRQHIRVPMNLEIEVILLSDNGNSNGEISSQKCQGRDISGGGVSFFSSTQYLPETLLRLCVSFSRQQLPTLKTSTKSLKVMGKVMWCKRGEEKDMYIAGVEFLNIYEDDFNYLVDYVNNNVAD